VWGQPGVKARGHLEKVLIPLTTWIVLEGRIGKKRENRATDKQKKNAGALPTVWGGFWMSFGGDVIRRRRNFNEWTPTYLVDI